jgi:hypothetical protein
MDAVWVFNGDGGRFPSGVFSSREVAEEWIGKHLLSGILTEYPLDIGVLDWALRKGYFKPKFPSHETPTFRQTFSSASQNHFHYQNGQG